MQQEHSDRHVTRLGECDVYLIDQSAILTGDQLDRLSLVLRVTRPVYPSELVHRLVNDAAYGMA